MRDSFARPRTPDRLLELSSCPAPLLTAVGSLPALLWETDSELRTTWATGGALPGSPQSAACLGAIFAAGLDEALRAHQNALLGQAATFEAHISGRDLHATVHPRRDAAGRVQGVIGIALDMTERMVSERALRFSEHGYRSLVEDAPYAICRTTRSGQLLQANRAMAEMLGYEAAEASELLLRDLPLIFAPSGTFEQFQEALLATGSHPGEEVCWLRRDGQTIQVRVSGRVVRDAAENISHLDIFAENVTEKKRLEAELGQAQRMQAIGQLAGGVAHDFNNLLTVILGQVDLLIANPADFAPGVRLGEIRNAAERAASLTRQLLAFSRRQVLQSRTVNLNEVIGPLMRILRRLIRENVELDFQAAPDLGSVRADPNELERVLVNLAVNAQDAMPQGGRLTIETANVYVAEDSRHRPDDLIPGSYVRILVRDTGHGMDGETRRRAFEPFFTTKQPNQGTGLGLSVVYGVVRQSGGYIHLESAPGAGSTFRIYLPRVEAAPVAAHQAAPAGTLPPGTETILVAEDDPGIRGLIADTLDELGYRVLCAADGDAAVEMASSHPGEIHLLLSDVVMPSLGGHEVAAALKACCPELKVILVSGYAGDVLAHNGLESASVFFLQKPFSMDSLAHTVRCVLDGVLP
jgi:two-component system cell cycle sensor histidine kinase/response regulator CckA